MDCRKIIILSALASLPFTQSLAQTQDYSDTLSINAVVITGTRTEKRLSEVPVLTTLITEREVEKSGSSSLLESLEDNIPGIISEPNGMGNNLRIRGLNSRYILFLVDGERLVGEGAGGNINLDQIDVASIKRIEMINGAASVLYGSNAVGAVINVITKEPQEAIAAGCDISYQSNNTSKTRVHVESRQNKFLSQASIYRNSSDGFGAKGDGAYAASYADWGGNMKLGYKFNARTDVNVTGRYFRHESFNPEGSLNATHPLTHNFSAGINGGYKSDNERYSLRASVNYDKYFDSDRYERKDETALSGTASNISSRLLNTFKPSEVWEIVAGAEQNHEENYSVKTLGSTPTTKSLDDVSLFGQGQYTAFGSLDIVGGARYTYNFQFGGAVTPKLSLMYKWKDFTFRAGSATAFRSPSIKELFYNFDHQGMFWVYGNPDLKAEKGLYNSLSAEYSGSRFYASAAAYRNDIKDKITQYEVVNELGGLEKYYKNTSSATITGLDINFSAIIFRHLYLKGSYSLCDATDNATGEQLSGNVKHSGTASATWNGNFLKGQYSVQIAGRFSSPHSYSSNDKTSLSKPYNIWKAVITKRFHLGKNDLNLTLKCDNLFNFQDPTFINPGRQYLIGLNYKFN